MLHGDNGDFCENSFLEEISEVIWSQEENIFGLEDENTEGFYEEFSDFTGGTTSSCSWHNDDFDMNSANKIHLSLEAIDDALYDQKKSPYISDEVFQECCKWSEKFPCLRLKGEQLLKSSDEGFVQCASSKQSTSLQCVDTSSRLEVIGKKMAIHFPVKCLQKNDGDQDIPNQILNYFEEVYEDDGNYEELFALDNRDKNDEFLSEKELKSETTSLKFLEERIIESVANEIYPKVLAMLQASTKFSDMAPLELPPLPMLKEQKHENTHRPRTEGSDLPIPDFPKLSSYLTVSPKVLQKKYDIHSGKSILQSSRPSSEIYLSGRDRVVLKYNNNPCLQSTELILKQNRTDSPVVNSSMKSSKNIKQDKRNLESLPSFPPVLEENTFHSYNVFNKLCLDSTGDKSVSSKTGSRENFRKHDSFLPPINNKYYSMNGKFTKKLLTCFDPQLNFNETNKRDELNCKSITPISRPTTGILRKVSKNSSVMPSEEVKEGYSVHNFVSHECNRKYKEAFDRRVTLFPIVTSLIPSLDKNNKKGFPFRSTESKKR